MLNISQLDEIYSRTLYGWLNALFRHRFHGCFYSIFSSRKLCSKSHMFKTWLLGKCVSWWMIQASFILDYYCFNLFLLLERYDSEEERCLRQASCHSLTCLIDSTGLLLRTRLLWLSIYLFKRKNLAIVVTLGFSHHRVFTSWRIWICIIIKIINHCANLMR